MLLMTSKKNEALCFLSLLLPNLLHYCDFNILCFLFTLFSFFSTSLSCAKNVHFCFSLPDSGEILSEEEKSVVTLRELFEECISDTDKSHQPPELAGGNPSPTTEFHRRRKKLLKPCKIRSIEHLPSFSPSCLSKRTKPKSKSIGKNIIQCNPHSSRTLVNFSLSDLRHATNNFSNGL